MAEITKGNYVFLNEGRAVLTGFNFMLRVEAVFDMPLKSVRAFTRDLEFDYIQEGGLNDYVHMRRKGISKPYTFEIDRYVGINYVDPLPLGANLLLPLILMVSRIPGQFIPLVSARTYTFTGCTVIKKTYGELDGNKPELLVETVTIAYRELVVLDAPWSEPAGEAIDNKHNNTNAISTEKNENALRKRCEAVVAEADELQKKVDEYGAALDKMPDGDVAENATEEVKKAAKAAKEAKEAATKPYTAAKDAVANARAAGVHARSFTEDTGLEELTEKAEGLLPAARDAVNALPPPPKVTG